MVSNVRASIVYEIENLDDLFDAYYLGRMEYSTFSILYDAYNMGGLSLTDIEALNVADRIELNLVERRADTTGFWSRLLLADRGRLGARRYSRDFRYISTDYYFNFLPEPVKIICNIREEDNNYDFRRRSVSFGNKFYEISLGHYLANEGYGLVIGRYDYRPIVSMAEDDGMEFWLPVNNYYNGLKAVYGKHNLGCRVYYSEKKYADNDKTFFGLGGGVRIDNLLINLAAGLNKYEMLSGQDERLALGASLNYLYESYALAGEYAVIEESGGLYLRAIKEFSGWEIETEFWSYDSQFENYNCSGPAANDYDEFRPNEDTLAFRSSQAGETGTAFHYNASMFSAGIQLWETRQNQDLKGSVYARYGQDITEKLKAHIQASYRNIDESDYFWSKIFIVSGHWPVDRLGIKAYFNDGTMNNGSSYLFSDIKFNLNQNIGFDLRIRNYLNGNNYWFLGESFTPITDLIIRGEFSYNRYARITLKVEKLL